MPKITKTPTMAFKAGQGAIWNNVIIHAAAKNKEIIALLRSLVQKIYLYFTINSLVRFAHSIRLFGEIKRFCSLDSIRRELIFVKTSPVGF